MNGTQDISWLSLFIGCSVIIIPILITWYYKTGLLKPLLISLGRMALQLFLVGFYLQYIFKLNSPLINISWVLIMLVAASMTIVRRSDLKYKLFFLPILVGVLGDVVVNGSIFLFIEIGPNNFFDARYLIPLLGMVIGNCINTAIIGIRAFYTSVRKEEEHYRYLLSQGANRDEALFPFLKSAYISSLNPTIASTASIGLIWLPGMMTGQILGGSDPVIAIKYQIMVVVANFAGGVITVFLSLFLSKRTAFDNLDMLNMKSFSKAQ